jgi:hypothetical protein
MEYRRQYCISIEISTEVSTTFRGVIFVLVFCIPILSIQCIIMEWFGCYVSMTSRWASGLAFKENYSEGRCGPQKAPKQTYSSMSGVNVLICIANPTIRSVHIPKLQCVSYMLYSLLGLEIVCITQKTMPSQGIISDAEPKPQTNSDPLQYHPRRSKL